MRLPVIGNECMAEISGIPMSKVGSGNGDIDGNQGGIQGGCCGNRY